jgi:hypothetical protein
MVYWFWAAHFWAVSVASEAETGCSLRLVYIEKTLKTEFGLHFAFLLPYPA